MRRFVLSLAMAGIAALSPTFSLAGDQETAQQIADGLRASGQLVDYSIGVKYKKGTAVLLGRVASDDQKTAAEHLAKGMTNVKRVVNKLEIKATAVKSVASRRPAGPAVRDAISTSVGRESAGPQMRLAARQVAVEEEGQDESPIVDLGVSDVAPQAAVRPMVRPIARQGIRVAQQVPRPMGAPGQFVPMQGRQPPMGRLAQAPGPVPMRGRPIPVHAPRGARGVMPARYDQAHMPNHAWPSYAAYPNYAGVTYPRQYSPTAWPYIGPFYPYPQVPLGWRKVTLEWDDGWWMLDFDD